MRNSYELIDFIMEKLKENGMIQQEFADRLGINKATMSRYVNHTRKFPINYAGQAAEILGLSLQELMDIEDPVKPFSHLSTALDIYISTGALKSMADYTGTIKEKVSEALERDIQALLRRRQG